MYNSNERYRLIENKIFISIQPVHVHVFNISLPDKIAPLVKLCSGS